MAGIRCNVPKQSLTLYFEKGPHHWLPKGDAISSFAGQSWNPYEAERWAHQNLMTGLFNLMAQKEPPLHLPTLFWWSLPDDIMDNIWLSYNRDYSLRDEQDFRKMYLCEFMPPEPSPVQAAGVGRTTDRKGDYYGRKRRDYF